METAQQVKKLFSIRVLFLLLLAAAISFGLAYVRDLLQDLYPAYHQAIQVSVILVFSVLLAYVVMAPLAKHLGFEIVGRSSARRKEHGDES